MLSDTWDNFLRRITPESYAESVVNAIYSTPGNTLKPDPFYDVDDLSSPNVYVEAKGTIKDAATALQGFATNSLFVVGAFILVAVFIYALAPALVRR